MMEKMEDFKAVPYDDVKAFVRDVQRAWTEHKNDPEAFHSATDKLMEEILIGLGYAEGVKIIRRKTRWYA